ncbi:MAG: hypothetical protein N2109_06990 [Fimbriimonadales bacterium]|nr:hypothetical protein [Fimbriimonadales bacterium]
MADPVQEVPKPEGYAPPTWGEVAELLRHLKRLRQPVIDRVWSVKKARRGQWDDVVRRIPASYRKVLVDPDLPMVRDMIQRVTGLIAKEEPQVQVIPVSYRQPEVRAAAVEESALHALRKAIEDQQDRPTYAMLVDAQAAWGESWLGIWPDSSRWRDGGFERGEGEDAEEYERRYRGLMLRGGVPICFRDFDPQTVYPLFSDHERLACAVIETEHTEYEVALGLGYRARRNGEGKVEGWERRTLSEPYVLAAERQADASVDRDSGPGLGGGPQWASATVKKVVYLDCWTMVVFLDGVEVERWEHNWGFVPLIPAFGEQTSDRDPGWQSAGVADAGLAVARQLVLHAAILTANAMQHGFPTPFLKNPAHGLVHPVTGEPIVRKVQLGEMNLLGPNEEIEFPYLNAQMMPDFFKNLDFLMNQLEQSTLSNFGRAIGSEMAGYAVAQIRAMQMSILSTIYTNAARQWRKAFYMLRHIIRKEFPGGIFLPGAIEETEDGVQYRPVVHIGPEHVTENPIEVVIPDGIPQDQAGREKLALEKLQAGVWSRRRVMEETGVEDPAREADEIDIERLLNSPAADQQVLILAMAMAAQRYQATEEQKSSPLMQEMAKARARLLGVDEQGQPGAPGMEPQNAGPMGEPMAQNPPVPQPQQGGPTQGAPPLTAFGIPGMPGGVKQDRGALV